MKQMHLPWDPELVMIVVDRLLKERDEALERLREEKVISQREIEARFEIEAKYMDKLKGTI